MIEKKRKLDEGTVGTVDMVVTSVSCSSSSSSSTSKRIQMSSSTFSKLRAIKNEKKKANATNYNLSLRKALSIYSDATAKRAQGLSRVASKLICEAVNTTFLNECKLKITRPTLIQYFEKGEVKKITKGPGPKICPTILKALSLHTSMCQVFGNGEAKPRTLRAVLDAAV